MEEVPSGWPRAGQTSVPLIEKWGIDELPSGCPRAGRSSVAIVDLLLMGFEKD